MRTQIGDIILSQFFFFFEINKLRFHQQVILQVSRHTFLNEISCLTDPMLKCL